MNKKKLLLVLGLSLALLYCSCRAPKKQSGFPYILPKERPNRKMSAAMERNYSAYMAPRPEHNELYSQFKYTELKGLDYNNHDGTITRRDPSKVIFAEGKYYVWYTHRHTPTPPQGPEKCTDTIPARDWDLSEIWYATSEDGFTWEEQGVAIPRPPKPNPGWRSVSTTDILIWEGKYYLYYQAFQIHPSKQVMTVQWPFHMPTHPMAPGFLQTRLWFLMALRMNGMVIPYTIRILWSTRGKSICTTNLISTEILA